MVRSGDLEISAAWSDYRLGAGGTTRLFFTLVNHGNTADRLLGASSPVAAAPAKPRLVIERDGQRATKALDAVPIPAESGRLELSAGGYFLELGPLRLALTMGSRFPVVLHFEHAGDIEVEFVNRFHAPGLGARVGGSVSSDSSKALTPAH